MKRLLTGLFCLAATATALVQFTKPISLSAAARFNLTNVVEVSDINILADRALLQIGKNK